MKSSKSVYIVFGVTLLLMLIFGAVMILHKPSSDNLLGTWEIATVSGVKVDPRSMGEDSLVRFELKPDGKCTMHPAEGTWSVDGDKLVLHTVTYNGQTREQFLADAEKRFPGDASMKKVADKEYEDLKLQISPDSTSLALSLSGVTIKYVRKPGG